LVFLVVVVAVVSAAGVFTVVSAGAAAGAAAIVSGVVGAAGVAAVESVVVVELLVLLPQDATNRPIDKAKMPNFTNFINVFFGWLYPLCQKQKKVTHENEYFLLLFYFNGYKTTNRFEFNYLYLLVTQNFFRIKRVTFLTKTD
jgi:hypothetical protein